MNIAAYRHLISGLYKEHVTGEGTLDGSWRAFFDGIDGAGLPTEVSSPLDKVDPFRTALILGRIIEQFRWRGHLAADLDPLGVASRAADPEIALDLAALSIGAVEPAPSLDGGLRQEGATLSAIVARLKEIYCGRIGYEYMHIENSVAREWLRNEIEAPANGPAKASRIAAAQRLIEADEFEQFLRRRFAGKKVFGAEGAESLLSLLWCILETGVSAGLRSVVMGGTSRARLNQLVNFIGKPAAAVIAEISTKTESSSEPGKSGDVPYHLGYTAQKDIGGALVTLTYCANPSHLEAVNTVAIGKVRAMQDELGGTVEAKTAIMPLLVHTDAAFAGQGVVAEAFQLGGLAGYSVGGTIHVVINNQIGFTTEPSDGRTSRYCTDAAKGIGAPVFHVNADDIDSVLRVGRLAMEYRQRFRGDAIIDLVCYRRRGHNELDEPAFTQPVMYRAVAQHPGARRIYLDKLHGEQVFSKNEEDLFGSAYRQSLQEAYRASAGYKSNAGPAAQRPNQPPAPAMDTPETGVQETKLRTIGKALAAIPAGIRAHPKVALLFEQRSACAGAGTGINWGLAEALALGSLISEGVPVRLSGQDTPRGAFSHRHFYVHDQEDGRRASIFGNLPEPRAPSWLIESPLAEYATLGFEYGYSVASSHALVIWEAQFGDFANVAQPVFDQFIASGGDKWGDASRLAVLMPHGLEGQGSEHSSGRIERFLQICAKDNMTIANCTTPANYFHLLRRQAHFANAPLIAFTPKSLLRHKLAVSTFAELASGTGFQTFIEPPQPQGGFSRAVLCSGKVYWELEAERRRRQLDGVGIARIEQLYPFPERELSAFLRRHAEAKVIWCQEEPQNMGVWHFAAPIISGILAKAGGAPLLQYVGRPANPSPAMGNTEQHAADQARIIAEALEMDRP
jgi:2-oxoglutarate dehydrogenase E1 component